MTVVRRQDGGVQDYALLAAIVALGGMSAFSAWGAAASDAIAGAAYGVITGAAHGKPSAARPTVAAQAAFGEVGEAMEKLSRFLGKHEGIQADPAAFRYAYLRDAEETLRPLSESARAYLDSDVLPMLRQSRSGEAVGDISPVAEADILGAILRADVDSAWWTAHRATTDDSTRRSLQVLARNAASLFEAPEEASLRVGPEHVEDLGRQLEEAGLGRGVGYSATHQQRVMDDLLGVVSTGNLAELDASLRRARLVLPELDVPTMEAARDLTLAFREAAPLDSEIALKAWQVEHAADGLYVDVSASAKPPGQDILSLFDVVERSRPGEQLGYFNSIRPRNWEDAFTPEQVLLAHDLLTELTRMPKEVLAHQTRILDAIRRAFEGKTTSVENTLNVIVGPLKAKGSPLPEEFFDRIRATARMHARKQGLGPREVGKFFGSWNASALPDFVQERIELADYLGGYSSLGKEGAIELMLASDPELVFSSLPPEARAYLENEVIPALREVEPETDTRYISEDSERRLIAQVLSGETAISVSGSLDVFADQEWESSLNTLLQTAATFFPNNGESPLTLRPFDAAEAQSLVQTGQTISPALRARERGGALIADLLEAIEATALERAPAYTQEHETRVLDGLVRAIAQGDTPTFEDFDDFANSLFVNLPYELNTRMRNLVAAFGE